MGLQGLRISGFQNSSNELVVGSRACPPSAGKPAGRLAKKIQGSMLQNFRFSVF
ncbi:MAG: hypothetical protein FD166_399 [Bacteroidetes bacterium]|nr:MAG: hypothetical protein FD166_399 [Bacteroidota bacterium]